MSLNVDKQPELAFLEYSFLFDPREVGWQSLADFERDLADYFAANELEAQIMKTIDGQVGRRILFIKKALVVEPEPPKPPQPAGKQLDKMIRRIGK